MSSLVGIIYKKNKAADASVIKKMLQASAVGNPEKTYVCIHENAAFGSHLLLAGKASEKNTNLLETESKILIFDAHFDQHQTKNKSFNDSFSKRISINTNEFYRNSIENGTFINCFKEESEKLRGDFSIAIWDKLKKELLCIRDHLGKRPLFYTETEEYFAFATMIKALFAIPGFTPEIDDLWIADSISTVKSEKDRSPYKNIKRLLPGHKLTFTENSCRIEKYWDLKVQPRANNMAEPEAVEIYKKLLFASIENKLINSQNVGSELSGGLDSSGVTAIAWSLLQNNNVDFYALSHAFSDDSFGKFFPFKDEREYSQSLIQHTGISNHIQCTAEGKGILDTLKKTIEIQSGPTQQGYNIFSDSLYENAQIHNVKLLFSGFGGDEGVTSQGAGIYEELIGRKMWQEFRNELIKRADLKNKSRLKATLRYYLSRNSPRVMKLLQTKLSEEDWRIPKFEGLGFDDEFGKRMNIRERYFERVWFPDDPDVRARQFKRILHDHVPQRFEYSYLAALNRGMEYAYPFWDVDLLEFYYSLPATLKVKNGWRRYIYRESMKGILPEKIRLRDDKTGATVPTVYMRFMNDYEEIKKFIVHSKEINKFNYLDYNKMLGWAERMKNMNVKTRIPSNPGAFFNSLQILLLQEMERTGEFKSGINI